MFHFELADLGASSLSSTAVQPCAIDACIALLTKAFLQAEDTPQRHTQLDDHAPSPISSIRYPSYGLRMGDSCDGWKEHRCHRAVDLEM
jgi:hypothetical protein